MTMTLTEASEVAAPAPRRGGRPRWERPTLIALLAGTALLYLWNLGASGYANDFYAAAAQAGSVSWKAWLFGSLDSGNVITVDKPPASLWLMGLSARIFGFSSWSLLVPQALCGVASVGVLYAAVRRWSGPLAGLGAGAVLALTPVAALMFRFDNPDALLVLLLVLGGYCVVRGTERAGMRWIVLAGVFIGFGFLTKMLQAFLVLPAFGLVYLVAAPTTLWRRIGHLAAGAGALVVSAGWWIALVDLWPASSRPYIGGSQGNSALELALGYNGLSRIFGGSGGGPGGGGGGARGGGPGGGNASFGGESGIGRLFGDGMATEISWLLPAALIGLVAGLWFTRRAPRTDRTRAALLLWGGWLLVTGLVFSYMQGTIHPYYTVALAPAIAALVAVSGRALWRGREYFAARATLAAMVLVTGVWSVMLLSSWLPGLRWVILAASVLVTTGLLMGVDRFRRMGVVLAVAGVLTVGAGTAAYAVGTASVPHTGTIPASGPYAAQSIGGPGGQTASAELMAALKATGTKWAAASVGAQGSSTLQLTSGRPVMAIGGFMGGDPAPSLATFKQYVADGQVRYFIAQGTGGFGGFRGAGGSGSAGEISSWVRANFASSMVGGQTVYDLTKPLS